MTKEEWEMFQEIKKRKEKKMIEELFKEMYKNLPEEHCIICGDEDNLVKVSYMDREGEDFMCDDCVRIQKNMIV